MFKVFYEAMAEPHNDQTSPTDATPPTNPTAANPLLDVAYIAVFAALVIVLAFVSIPVGTAGVPIVLQNAAIILSGLILGRTRGFLVALLFLGLGMVGLPVLAGGRSTLSALGSPTIGYLIGYMVSATVAGAIAYLAPRNNRNLLLVYLSIGALAALACQYICGSFGLMWRADMTFLQALAVNTPFIIPDLVKIVFIVAIASGVHLSLPDIRRKAFLK